MPLFTPPLPILSFLVKYGIGIIILSMLIRAIASWFRMDERYAFIRFLARITDPFISPVRRLVPPVGFIDLSFIVTLFLLIIMSQLLQQALPFGW
jgi:YggT family protein